MNETRILLGYPVVMSKHPAVLGAVLLEAQRAARHRLPTTALAVSVGGMLSVGEGEGRTTSSRAFLLGAGVPHTGAASGLHAMVLVDDLSPLGRALAHSHASIVGGALWLRELQRAVVAHAAELTSPGVLTGLLDEWLRRSSQREDWRAPPLDPRVEAAVEAIECAVREGVAPPSPLVRGVSAVHLRALFRRDVGRTISEHTRARRMLMALREMDRGSSVTTTAHDVGFADTSHLSRTARASFGMSLRELRRGRSLRWSAPAALGSRGKVTAVSSPPRLAPEPSVRTSTLDLEPRTARPRAPLENEPEGLQG